MLSASQKVISLSIRGGRPGSISVSASWALEDWVEDGAGEDGAGEGGEDIDTTEEDPVLFPGLAINLFIALAATTSGEARYASAFLDLILLLKFWLVADILTSPSLRRLVPKPIHEQQPAGSPLRQHL